MIKVVVSACLLGEAVRPDGQDRKSHHPILRGWIEEDRVVSICPEMLGGLGTPRPPAEMVSTSDGIRVVTNGGEDVTHAFSEGARLGAHEAQAHAVRVAVLKDGSPSCGSSYVYDGTFSKTRIPGRGVTAELLRQNGIHVFSEDEIEAASELIRELERAGVQRT